MKLRHEYVDVSVFLCIFLGTISISTTYYYFYYTTITDIKTT